MPPERIRQVNQAIAELVDVDPLERKTAIAEFMQKSHQPVPQQRSFDVKPASSNNPPNPFGNFSVAALASALQQEHPQTVAIVLASMQPQDAADLLQQLPSALRSQAVSRLSRLGDIPTDAVSEIVQQLSKTLEEVVPKEPSAENEMLHSILRHVDADQQQGLVSELSEHDSALALRIARKTSKAMNKSQAKSVQESSVADKFESTATEKPRVDFRFVEDLPSDALRRLLAHVDLDTAILALCTMPSGVVRRLLNLLPRPQKHEVQQRIRAVGNLKLREIDAAQTRVSEVAYELQQTGKLVELGSPSSNSGRVSLAA